LSLWPLHRLISVDFSPCSRHPIYSSKNHQKGRFKEVAILIRLCRKSSIIRGLDPIQRKLLEFSPQY